MFSWIETFSYILYGFSSPFALSEHRLPSEFLQSFLPFPTAFSRGGLFLSSTSSLPLGGVGVFLFPFCCFRPFFLKTSWLLQSNPQPAAATATHWYSLPQSPDPFPSFFVWIFAPGHCHLHRHIPASSSVTATPGAWLLSSLCSSPLMISPSTLSQMLTQMAKNEHLTLTVTMSLHNLHLVHLPG